MSLGESPDLSEGQKLGKSGSQILRTPTIAISTNPGYLLDEEVLEHVIKTGEMD
jgi:hypothetical protein